MKVMVLGIRGIPNVAGGVETHAEQLYSRLANRGCAIEVLTRSPFVPADRTHFGSIRLRRLWAPRQSGLEALIHSVLGALYAGFTRPDVLHVHAVGPSIVVPLARLMGLRVVMTHHGPDYDRDKWGGFARFVLRLGERAGVCTSHARISISRTISDLIQTKYGRDAHLIPNGVTLAEPRREADHIRRFGLEPGRYVLQVSRLVPEKRQLDLIKAYVASGIKGWHLVLVGGIGSDAYSREVVAAAAQAGVVLTNFQRGAVLEQLYSHAGAFVLPSSHEGLPIALLEAMSYGLPVLASDIPANVEIGLDAESYFPLGDTAALAKRLREVVSAPIDDAARAERRAWVASRHDWERISQQTLNVYRSVVREK